MKLASTYSFLSIYCRRHSFCSLGFLLSDPEIARAFFDIIVVVSGVGFPIRWGRFLVRVHVIGTRLFDGRPLARQQPAIPILGRGCLRLLMIRKRGLEMNLDERF